jgi:hypothetical protein
MIAAGNQAPQRRGASAYSNASVATGVTTVVAAGANTNGLIIRTLCCTATPTAANLIRAGTIPIIAVYNGAYTYEGAGILVPAGQALDIESGSGAAGILYITYDLL